MPRRSLPLVGVLLAGCTLSAFPVLLAAQSYPAKPVRIVVGFAPGGATDIVGRLIAQKLSEATGQSFFVENRPGASATIAAELVARAAPDGYTLIIAATTSHSILPSLMAKLAYDPQRDYAPVSQLATSPLLLALHPSLPVRSVTDLIKLARARPGQLSFGAGGTGTPPHMAGELFKQMAGVDMLYVPYKGEAPAISDLMREGCAASRWPPRAACPRCRNFPRLLNRDCPVSWWIPGSASRPPPPPPEKQ